MMEHQEVQELLGAYTLRAVSAAELEAVRQHLIVCEECRTTADRLAQVVEFLPLTAPAVSPPPGLRDRILVAITREEPSPAQAVEIPPRPAWLQALPYATAAMAAALVLVLTGWAFSLRGRLAAVERELDQARQQLAGVQAGNFVTTDLRSGGPGPATWGRLVYLQRERATLLMCWNLPGLPRGKVYQVWFELNGELRSAGILTVYPDGRGALFLPSDISNARAILITVEPEPSSPVPSGDTVLEVRL